MMNFYLLLESRVLYAVNKIFYNRLQDIPETIHNRKGNVITVKTIGF